ncbi:endonuclease/exonuclease/phosphatase family protein [Lysinibacillus sp. NPDC097214]|uniref:endonuclease/exonuclease/phosphatase family protein n=1 Tax=Lysinibacillus sp. NPDC097214 TaxID=3390584 RepID=UPI003D03E8E3
MNKDTLEILAINVNDFGGLYPKKSNLIDWNSEVEKENRKNRIIKLINYLSNKNPEIIVLLEFDSSTKQIEFLNFINEKGYAIVKENIRGSIVVVIHKIELKVKFISQKSNLKAYAKWIEINIELNQFKKFNVIGVHVPLESEKRIQFQKKVQEKFDLPTVLIGDFNAATNDDRAIELLDKSRLNENTNLLNNILNNNFVDSWREVNGKDINEYTWFNSMDKNDGRRLDYAFVTNDIEILAVNHLPELNMILDENGFTDHSGIEIKIK